MKSGAVRRQWKIAADHIFSLLMFLGRYVIP